MRQNETGPEQYVCFKLSKVMRKVQRYYEQKLTPFDLTPVQFYVFNSLWRADGQKFKELAENLHMDGSTLTGLLDRMERAGFVERQDDPSDRRSLLIFLTVKAKEVAPVILQLAEQFDRDVRKDIPEEKFLIFLEVLDQLFAGDF